MSDWNFTSAPLEVDEENKTVAWAENNGWLARKVRYLGLRGAPDRWFFGFGKIVIVEFKRPSGGHLAPAQVRERRKLGAAGIVVHVCHSADEAINVLKGQMP